MKIEIKNLKHKYPSGGEALRGINTTFEGSNPVAIIGQNGAGKTTFAKHLNGLLRPTEGQILIDGESISDHTTAYWSKYIGYVFQNPDNQLFLETVRKEFEFGPKQQGLSRHEINDRIEFISDLVGLKHRLSTHPFDLNATEKKFCTIGSILMMDPKIIILDEPTCGQDVEGNQRLAKIINYLKNNDRLCITITHDMKFVVRNFDQIIVMSKGEILKSGNKYNVFSDVKTLLESHVAPPPITRVGQALRLKDISFSKEEFIDHFTRRIHQS
ncbi:energy-coupling factor ABC transporter ATP-binding protein [Paenibacillus solani]|uniref:ABC transporter n=1 Tax=Paenibacillus solani TaxID=1705565 RepID=A0A0M1P1T9_9BACL|nr:ATP-binding cassette domain-containing protein [Paenibacillus solani]KOR88044.1 ABC transporter [Paenibacillus solani]